MGLKGKEWKGWVSWQVPLEYPVISCDTFVDTSLLVSHNWSEHGHAGCWFIF
jgi:hypothetical protein